MSRKPRILFFDSGMGGLSHLKQVENTYFDFFDYYFLFDNELFPYSERPDSVLIEKLIPLISRAIKELEIDLVVIACNTASTLILDQLREKVKIPVIGVVPALKPAVEYLVSKGQTNKAIGLLATKATIARPYVLKLIEFYTEPVGHNVSLLGTTDLVEYVEAKIRHKETNKDLRKILAPWLNNDELNLGVIVLACTHFPLVKDEIQELFPNILLIDTCFAIARRIGVLYGFFKKKEIEAQRKEFIDYLNKIKLESHDPVNNKHLLSTKLLTEAEFNELKGQGFADYTCFPHQ